MKRSIFLLVFVASGLLFANRSQAQLSISVNIGSQPAWAPEGYDNTPYYYLPDMDMYYDVPAHQFLYMNGGRWVRTSTLPSSYRKFDLYKIHKVPINQRDAYKFHDRDRKQYAQYKGQFDQHPIRDSKDQKYSQNRNNWGNNRFNGHDKGNDHNDRGRGGHH